MSQYGDGQNALGGVFRDTAIGHLFGPPCPLAQGGAWRKGDTTVLAVVICHLCIHFGQPENGLLGDLLTSRMWPQTIVDWGSLQPLPMANGLH